MSVNPVKIHRARCRETRELLSDYLEGEVEPNRQRAFNRHLRWCPNCGRMAQNLSRTVDGLRRLGGQRPPRDPVL